MSEPELEPEPRVAGKRGGRGTTAVAVVALVVAVLGGAVAVLSYLKASHVQDDLRVTQVALRGVRNDLDDQQTHLQSAQDELKNLITEVHSVRDDLSAASSTVEIGRAHV